MVTKFEMAIRMYNSSLVWEEKGYRIDYKKDDTGEYGYIVLPSVNGIESYILNLKNEELEDIVKHFKDLDIEIQFNNIGSIFWERYWIKE